jgi:hypothetical protein
MLFYKLQTTAYIELTTADELFTCTGYTLTSITKCLHFTLKSKADDVVAVIEDQMLETIFSCADRKIKFDFSVTQLPPYKPLDD